MNYLWWQQIFFDDVVSILGPTPVVHDTRICNNEQRFKENEYEVVRKDGLVFLREMAAEVKNFMDFKMSAVMVSHLLDYWLVIFRKNSDS